MSILNMKSSSPRLISPPRVHAKKYILRLEETTKLLSKRCDNIQNIPGTPD